MKEIANQVAKVEATLQKQAETQKQVHHLEEKRVSEIEANGTVSPATKKA